MLVAVDHVPVHTNQTGRESRLFGSTSSYVRRNAVAIFRAYAMYEPLRVFTTAAVVLAIAALAAWTPFLADWILNGDSSGHVQSLILGAVLAIAAVQMFALGVIGDALAGQRVMAQRAFERIRRVELSLGIEPSHYEPAEGQAESPPAPIGWLLRSADRSKALDAGQAAKRYGRTASLLSVAVGATGFIVYLYFALAAHNLDAADYGDIATLWLVVFVTVATLYRPVEQLLSRTIAERHARPGSAAVRSGSRRRSRRSSLPP